VPDAEPSVLDASALLAWLQGEEGADSDWSPLDVGVTVKLFR
jgi:PIN domain nuclease of toxin-antitoxin system